MTRLFLIATVFALLGGPVLATGLAVPVTPTLTAPHGAGSTAGRVLALLGGGLAVFGAIRIKDTGTLANKFVTRATAAAGDYKDGVAQAGGDWEANAKASEGNYNAGVQEAISQGRFGKGISAAGQGKYVTNATNLGAVRFGPGVQNAKDAWARGVQPALDKLKSLNLPPKGPRRSPQNQQRANMVAIELGKLKTGQ